MSTENKQHTIQDVIIVGGGLAGLSLAIQLAKGGRSVTLFEKETYPFHRVCGEYISNESRHFLNELGLDIDAMQLPEINTLMVSAPSGTFLESKLDLGGFGISRYFLDHELYTLAKKSGATIVEGTKVSAVNFKGDHFEIHTSSGITIAKVVAGTFGKRSNLDVKWKRPFIQDKPGKLNNYVGVKYHIRTTQKKGLIALHNFANGYCGISQIEDDKYCLCYLTSAVNLKRSNYSIKEMEKDVLYKNPFLKLLFLNADFIFEEPVTISQISFQQKSLVEDHVLMIGDAAGMITPLCGNGMSMALHASKISYGFIRQFLNGSITREQMEEFYVKQWNVNFGRRLKTGRLIQSMFGNDKITSLFVSSLKQFPWLVKQLITATHGKSF
ncbi:MAG: NAD(P)/FAD-dependent oxidoreductase [Ginsengibacter sp.]